MTLKISGDTARTQFVDFDGGPKDCTLDLKLEAGKQIQLLKHSGSECEYFCTDHRVVIPEQAYPLKSKIIFPRLFARECFADARKSRQIWCASARLQQLDSDLGKTGERIGNMLHRSDMYKEIDATRESILDHCNKAENPEVCTTSSYENELAKFADREKAAQKTRSKEESSLVAAGNPAKADELIAQIEGVYKTRFQNGSVDDSSYTSEDILEIVRVSPNTVYFRTHLEFYNGHTCDKYGLARFSQAGVFVFNDPAEPLEENAPHCRLQFQVTQDGIRMLDRDSTCKEDCGARGNFDGATFPRSSRRPIRYMDRLKRSAEYQEAIGNLDQDTSH